MDVNELRGRAEKIRQLAYWAKHEYYTVYVELEDTREFDLGDFGYRETTVNMVDEEYQIDPQEMLSASPTDVAALDEVADELEALADELDELEKPTTLNALIGEMLISPNPFEAELAKALAGVIDLHDQLKDLYTTTHTASGISGPLPESPLPWPGALNPDIDYTAEDFPLRFQPPPGFVWVRDPGSYAEVTPEEAGHVEAHTLVGTTGMVLDDYGRVSWGERANGNFDEGNRWCVWHEERDGIPRASGFSDFTPPRSLDAWGRVIPEPHTLDTEFGDEDFNWDGDGVDFRKAKARLAKLHANAVKQPPSPTPAFEPPAEVKV